MMNVNYVIALSEHMVSFYQGDAVFHVDNEVIRTLATMIKEQEEAKESLQGS